MHSLLSLHLREASTHTEYCLQKLIVTAETTIIMVNLLHRDISQHTVSATETSVDE